MLTCLYELNASVFLFLLLLLFCGFHETPEIQDWDLRYKTWNEKKKLFKNKEMYLCQD